MTGRHATTTIAAVALATAALAPAAAEAAKAPRIEQLVAFRDGGAKQKSVTATAATARVGSHKCAVGAGTPLAALIHSKPGKILYHDYGACSKRPADAAGLYVRAIAGERAKGQNGWVYKVGNKVATAGAADPAGPFGRGRLRSGARVTWFYCRMSTKTNSCQRTLGVVGRAASDGTLKVTVRSYDDRGRSNLVRGATVHAGSKTAKTGADGTATLQAGGAEVRFWASAKGLVRSFEETVGGP
jgi:hypothetical protein